MDFLRILLVVFLSSVIIYVHSQTLDFTLSTDVCLDEKIDIINSSSGISNISWNICNDDFNQAPVTSGLASIGTIGLNRGIEIVNDGGNFFGFLTDFADGEIYRIDFGISLNNLTPSVSKIFYSGNSMVNPEEIRIYKIGSDWFGFVGSASSSTGITRLDFGSSLLNTPTAVGLGNFGYSVQMRDLHLVADNGSYILLILDLGNERFIRVNYGSSILLSPVVSVSTSISGLSNTSGFDILKIDNTYYSYLTSIDGNSLAKIEFGTSVLNNPILISSYNPAQLNRPFRIKIINNLDNYFAIVTDLNQSTAFFDLGDLITSNPTYLPYSLSNANSYSGMYYQGSYFYYGLSATTLNQHTFHTDCGASIDHSDEYLPDFNFNSSGTKKVGISTISSGNQISIVKEINVNSSESPSISLSTNNACATASSTFTPSTTGLTYSWDFDEDGMEDSNLENPSFAFGTPGTYTVRLDVDDGTCHNFTTQDITLYEEPPVPAFNISGDLCTTNTLTFGNTTDDTAYAGPLTYAWDFNGEGSSAIESPSFAFATPGLKTITLTSSIPGCEHVSQQQVEILAGPVASFSANPICQGELMSFTNSSTGADTYFWDFGDGFTSTQSNPGHVYSTGGNFTVSLYATETSGCTTLYQQEVAVSHLPNAQFDYDIPCSGSQGIAFYDLSSVTGADILSWNWFVDNVPTTTNQHPTLSFDEAGSRVIRLEVMSSNGCSATAEETIQVLGTPLPSFDAEINCQGQTSTFTDTTPGTVISRLWNINGQNYTTATVSHVFAASGDLNVSLTVTSSDFCTSTTSSMVSVTPAPAMGFSISSLCVGDNILLTDNSTSTDPIVSRTWTLDGNSFFNGTQALLTNATPGAHTLALQVETASGCSFTSSQNVTLLASPVAGFTSSATAGVPPFPVTFTNSSSGATGYVWRVNGTQVSTSTNLTQVFSQLGNQIVELTAINADGCESKMSTTISSVTPAIDLQVRNVQVITNGASSNVTVTIGNEGNLPIEIFDLIVRTGNNDQVSERFNSYIGIGEEVSVGFSSTLQMGNANRLCVSVVSAYTDIHPDDNDACINYSSHIILEHPYPNPITDEATFRLILPSEKSVQLTITHVSGRMLINEQFNDLSSGLHILRYDASQWKKGIYLVTVRSGSDVVTRKVVVD